MRAWFLWICLAASCAAAPTSIEEKPRDSGTIDTIADAGADDAVADAGGDGPRVKPNDLCGTPRDAPDGTACGYDGLGYVWMHGCYYSCRLKDMSCAPPVLSEYCDQMCTAPQYLPFQSCTP